jgi:trehalose 6-phosphate synthase
VASRVENDGVLILSEFAGAAEELGESLLVNPYDTDQIADRLKYAIGMSAIEQTERMRALRAKVFANNLENWSEMFLSALAVKGARAGSDDENFEI